MTSAFRPDPLFRFSSRGTANAKDLPLPVSARIIALRLLEMIGIACICTGVGCIYPQDLMLGSKCFDLRCLAI
jgi:hypothetical protein